MLHCRLFRDPTGEGKLTAAPVLKTAGAIFIEVGPRLNVCTPFSTNALSICKSVGLPQVTRVETTRRFAITASGSAVADFTASIAGLLHDRMTECTFTSGISSFELNLKPDPWDVVDVMGRGPAALKEVSDKLGLAFDTADIDMYVLH